MRHQRTLRQVDEQLVLFGLGAAVQAHVAQHSHLPAPVSAAPLSALGAVDDVCKQESRRRPMTPKLEFTL